MTELQGPELVAAARAIAMVAHLGQVDKSGNPYIEHPARVVARVIDNYSDAAVAWLHDVLEDTNVTADALLAAGIPAHVVADVQLLTRADDETVEDYYQGIRQSFTARRVKRADIADNSDVNRLALLDDATIVRLVRKYAKARRLLGETKEAT